MAGLLLHGADYLVQSADRYIRDGALYVEDGVIRAVGPSAVLRTRHRVRQSIDLSGCIVTPGLVNAHNHLYEMMARGLGKDYGTEEWLVKAIYPINRLMTAEDYYCAAVVGLAACVGQGITSVIDQLTNYARFHADRTAEAFLESGIRGAVARGAADQSAIDRGEERPAEEDLSACEAYLNGWAGRPRFAPWLGPSGIFSCSPPLLKRLKDLANAHGARFMIHLSETAVQARMARRAGFAGQVAQAHHAGILDERTAIAHAVWVGEEELAIAAASGASIVHNPVSNMALASGVADVPAMLALGIPVGLGTDSNDSLDMFDEMRAAVLLHRVHTLRPTALHARDAFRMATEAGARVLGVDRLGRLEPGWKADVAAFRIAPSMVPVYDPVDALVYYGSGRDACLTVVDGEVLYRDGLFTRVDPTDAITRLARTAEVIRRKVPLAFSRRRVKRGVAGKMGPRGRR
jgi:5-methylthioadenosine/S-adenosylhomocysteine deaminase